MEIGKTFEVGNELFRVIDIQNIDREDGSRITKIITEKVN